jgi:hypothetical protein
MTKKNGKRIFVMNKLTAVFSQLKGFLKRKKNPRIEMLQTLQAHYRDRARGGLTLTNKVRQSVGIALTEQIPLTDEQADELVGFLESTKEHLCQK